MRSWRLALRVARRDALRARGRSLLVLVMIALPVAAVAIADTAYNTSDVSGGERSTRRHLSFGANSPSASNHCPTMCPGHTMSVRPPQMYGHLV